MWFIGVEVEQETRAPPPKKNPGSAPEQEGSVKRCQDKVLRKLTTAAATTRLRLCRKKKKNIWSNLERLPFVRKTWKFREEFKWNGSSRWNFFFRKKSDAFRGITFFLFY